MFNEYFMNEVRKNTKNNMMRKIFLIRIYDRKDVVRFGLDFLNFQSFSALDFWNFLKFSALDFENFIFLQPKV